MASFTNATLRTSIAGDLTHTSLIIQDYIRPAVYSARVMDDLITVRDVSSLSTDTVSFPAWPALAATTVAENADLANTEINPTSVSVTVGEVGIMATLSDVANEDDILASVQPYAEQLSNAVSDKWDADAAALLAGFSNTTDSGGTDAGNALVLTDFLLALRDLESRDAPRPYQAVLHPVQFSNLAIDIHENGGAIFGGNAPQDARLGVQRAFKGNLFDTPIYTTTNAPTGTVGTTTPNPVYIGAIFSKEALTRVIKREPRVEMERDASARLTEIVLSSRYGTGELADDWGQAIRSDQDATGVGA